jgi:glucose-1-phosphate thymidylyltransferase
MWGIIPAAGVGSRIQPLAFSKELLPVGARFDGTTERPRAVSEYIVERMVLAGATRICFVVGPGKADILEYFGSRKFPADLCFVVQPVAAGLCDALFRPLPFIPPGEMVCVGLPDTVWFPRDGLQKLPDGQFSFLTFPVEKPELFDTVVSDSSGRVLRIEVNDPKPSGNWIWGTFQMPVETFLALRDLWRRRDQKDEYIGTLVNAYLAEGGSAYAVPAGTTYMDIGTLDGYRRAIHILKAGEETESGAGVLVSNGPGTP